jgi:tetratricopeptide (TPR) repeat protein/tRNA A-37 threonylcarbamoyl transferase component Bud32
MGIRVEELFCEVADLPAEARAQYFVERNVDEQTRKQVEALLAFDSRASLSLDRDIGELAQRALAQFEETSGHCGPYRLGDLLGRGGMGSVYLADRVDGEVAQRVAVKLLRPGADDPQLRRRFLAERQILASLSHPNIARLLDAGHREDGQPYLAMEYVPGTHIDLYAAGLRPRQKLALFLKVCAAVSHLHRNLVVHRDLKPSNILVTAEGEPKLLDFGIAKILDLTVDSTVTSLRMLTPDYASPEQVLGGPITTSTDIYSLGAVLYKLLTGVSPHRFEGDSAGATVFAASGRSITPPSRLVPGLQNDLEAIVMKALRREPQERYASVEQFSDDLENYLRSRPIRARKGDAWYRARKFLRRQWLPVTAAAFAVAGLTSGVVIANHERAIAERRFADVRQLAAKLFDIDEQVAKLPGGTETRRLIMDTSLEYLRRVTADVRLDSDLALDMGSAYMRVARVQRIDLALGQAGKADATAQKAQDLVDSALASQPRNRAALLLAAEIAQDRLLIARHRRPADALRFADQTEQRVQQYLSSGSPDRSNAENIILAQLNVSNEYYRAGRFDDAIRISQRTIQLARATNWPLYVGGAYLNLAAVYHNQGDLEQALQAIRESVRILSPPAGEERVGRLFSYSSALIQEGEILGGDDGLGLKRPKEAAVSLEQAIEVAEDLARRDPNEFLSRERLFSASALLAQILRYTDPRRSLELCDHALQRLAEIKNHPGARLHEVEVLAASTYPLQRLGRGAEARQRLDAAFDRLRQVGAYPVDKITPGSEADEALSALADFEAGQGNFARAAEIYKDLLRKISASEPKLQTSLPDAVEVSRVYTALADLHRRAHQSEAQSDMEARRLELWRHWDAKLPNNSFVGRQLDAANRRVE